MPSESPSNAAGVTGPSVRLPTLCAEQLDEQTFGFLEPIFSKGYGLGFANRIGNVSALVQPIHRVPIESFPCSIVVVEAEVEQREDRAVDLLTATATFAPFQEPSRSISNLGSDGLPHFDRPIRVTINSKKENREVPSAMVWSVQRSQLSGFGPPPNAQPRIPASGSKSAAAESWATVTSCASSPAVDCDARPG